MNNQSIGLNNETFFAHKESMMGDSCVYQNDGNTKISDVSREFRELNGEIYKTIQNNGDASGMSNQNNNNTKDSIGVFLDNTWMNNNKNTSDCSDNFQTKLNEIKKKAKTPSNKNFQQQKNIKTLIINPQIVGHPFIPISNQKQNENFSQNLNYNQTIFRNDMSQFNHTYFNNFCSDYNEEDETLPPEETLNSEQINKLHVNLVKTNNLNVLNNRQANFFYSYNFLNEGNDIHNTQGNEESYKKEVSTRDVLKISQSPQLAHLNSNGISTKESNDSPDSLSQNKCIAYDDSTNQYNLPGMTRNYTNHPVINATKGKKLNFNNCGMNPNYPMGNQYMHNNPSFNNGFSGGMNQFMNDFHYNIPTLKENFPNNRLINSYNIPNLPENAFTYNFEMTNNSSNYKCNSDKKKIKKSKDEVDQTLFMINLDNIIYGRDKRTTIMIRHIPNKYTTQSLLEEIDSNFKGKYDFFYLPMDFENQCNLGYAFINFVDPLHILLFYDIFKARKWKRYKSHKECDLSYAKFQGKVELTSHLEKSWVMNKIGEDKKPIILTPVEPLPKIEIPSAYVQLFKTLYPFLVNKAIFHK